MIAPFVAATALTAGLMLAGSRPPASGQVLEDRQISDNVRTPPRLAPGQTGQSQESIARLAEAAEAAMREERYADAVPLYEQLLGTRPDDAGLLMNLGMAQTLAGAPGAALQVLERATSLDPSLTPAWLFLGMAASDVGDPERAVGALEKALEGDPSNLGARRLLAEGLLALGRPHDAAREYRRAAEQDPSSPRVWYGLAVAYSTLTADTADSLRQTGESSPYKALLEAELALAADDPQKAITLVEPLLKQHPNLSGARLALADAYEATGRQSEAEAARARERELAADCTARTAECALLGGDALEAASLAERDSDPAALYWRLQAYNTLSTEAWARLEALPPTAETHYVRAVALEDQGRRQEAAEELRQAHALDPENPQVLRRLAVLLLQTRQSHAAIELLTPVSTSTRPEPELRYLLGEALLQSQRPAEAVLPLEQALEYAPDLLPARGALGRAYVETGKYEDAIPHLEAALSLDRDGSLYYQLAQAYQRTGRPDDARRALAEYQKKQ